jgi:hypothetical protein
VAALYRESVAGVEGDGEAGLPLGKKVGVASVGLFRRGEAGKLAHGGRGRGRLVPAVTASYRESVAGVESDGEAGRPWERRW